MLEQACLEAGGRWEGPQTDCVSILAARCQAVRPGDLDDNDQVDDADDDNDDKDDKDDDNDEPTHTDG